MNIRYHYRYRDFWQYALLNQLTSPRLQGIFLAITLGLAWGTAQEAHCLAQHNCWGLGIGYLCGYYALINTLWYAVMAFNAFSRANKTLFSQYQLEIQDAGLYLSTEFEQHLFAWQKMGNVVEQLGIVVVNLDINSALDIPARAFASKAEKTLFIEDLRQSVRAASGKVTI